MSIFYEPYSLFDRLFDEAFSTRTGSANQNQANIVLRPRMNLHEDLNANVVTATFEFPGLRKEDVHIDVHNERLTVSAESKISLEHKQDGYAVREKTVCLHVDEIVRLNLLQDDQIKAMMENGVLTVTFQKSSPELTPKKITIS